MFRDEGRGGGVCVKMKMWRQGGGKWEEWEGEGGKGGREKGDMPRVGIREGVCGDGRRGGDVKIEDNTYLWGMYVRDGFGGGNIGGKWRA